MHHQESNCSLLFHNLEAIQEEDESEEDSFVVNGVVTDESLSFLRGGLLELFGSESSALDVRSSL